MASGSLEEVFARVTQQDDYSEVAKKILAIANGSPA
jgi:hypothetical protein